MQFSFPTHFTLSTENPYNYHRLVSKIIEPILKTSNIIIMHIYLARVDIDRDCKAVRSPT